VITIRGVVYPSVLSLVESYRDLSDFIADTIEEWRNYVNGTKLFILYNTFSFGDYFPLKLMGLNYVTSSDLTIPEITLNFIQVQTTTATSYSTTDTSGARSQQPQDQPQISR
jgi:hypothetical protein